MMQGKDNRGRHTGNAAGQHPIRTISAPPPSSFTIFTLDAIPAATLQIYPGLALTPSMLDCIHNGFVNTDNKSVINILS